jgi:hypothetical protein
LDLARRRRSSAEGTRLATVYHCATLKVPAEVAWDFVDRYTRSEVHIFSVCVREYEDGDTRVVVLGDGTEVRELSVTVDPERMRAVYTVPGLPGVEHHQAEMRVVELPDEVARLEWCTDVLPNEYAEQIRGMYGPMFDELVAAVNAHELP